MVEESKYKPLQPIAQERKYVKMPMKENDMVNERLSEEGGI